MKTMHLLSLVSLNMAVFAWVFDACATERADVVSGLSTVSQLTVKLSGDVTMAVLYDPANNASVADAGRIKSIVDGGVALPGAGKLSAILVSTSELGKLARAQIAFLSVGLATHYNDINMAASAASILTVTTDIDCVRAAKCIIGVATQPSLSIYYSKQAADNAKIEFNQAFSMLVKQP